MELDGAAPVLPDPRPDVSVIVPVYNTRPYLTRCLASLAAQTLAVQTDRAGRMELVAVDDGSTDGSGAELDRFARRHPGWVTVIHQPNSGGPASPCNRGLDVATGRYVFFVGADDYLAPHALERMVAAADRWESDVLLPKMVGVNNRFTSQDIFARTAPEVSLFDSALPYSLANTKMFRRDLIDRHGLRYPEDMPMGSDQPFTIEACVRARRISVLADDDYYYIVRRLDAGNITYSTAAERRLRALTTIMTVVAKLVDAGPQRDAVLERHFRWEAAKLVDDRMLAMPRPVQERIKEGVAELVGLYLTDRIRERLEPDARLRLVLARDASLDDLLAAVTQDARRGVPPTVVEGGRSFAAYPGFRDPARRRPDEWYEVTDFAAAWSAKLDATEISWAAAPGGRALEIVARSPRPDLPGTRVRAGRLTGAVTQDATGDGGTVVRARFGLARLVADAAPRGARGPVLAEVTVDGVTGSAPVRAPRLALPRPALCRRGPRLYAVAPRIDDTGYLIISITPVTPRRVVAALRRRWPRTQSQRS